MATVRQLHDKALESWHEAERLHDKGMALADMAFVEGLGGVDFGNASRQVALAYEALAATEVPNSPQSEPTKSILFRSAASLALQCERYRDAAQLIYLGLCGDPPPKIKQELLALLAQVIYIAIEDN